MTAPSPLAREQADRSRQRHSLHGKILPLILQSNSPAAGAELSWLKGLPCQSTRPPHPQCKCSLLEELSTVEQQL